MVVRCMSPGELLRFLGVVFWVCAGVAGAYAGDYGLSAHGDSSYGVLRGGLPAAYVRGNCAHCHEMHTTLETASEEDFTLFGENYNSGAGAQSIYAEGNNLCFACHNASGSEQQVLNYDFSSVFGGAGTTGVTSILGAFNQLSDHNLYDIWSFSRSTFSSWFTDSYNPCDACHNPHLARRNFADPDDPADSVISLPSTHGSLYGDSADNSERMDRYSYQAPYSTTGVYEPAGSAVGTGVGMPDYVGFCTACHNTTMTIPFTSTTSSLMDTIAPYNVIQINWTATGDKHGSLARDGDLTGREPFLTAKATNMNFVLSCCDCHEAHGAPNVALVRRRVNGTAVSTIATMATANWANLCATCHNPGAPAWRSTHHAGTDPDAPYKKPGQIAGADCSICHGATTGTPIDCTKCHFHGSDDSHVPDRVRSSGSFRKTF